MESIPLQDPGTYESCKASAAVLGGRFVKISDDADSNGNTTVAHSGAGEKVYGVAQYDVDPAAGDAHDGYVTVATGVDLVMPVLAGGAITAGDSVVSGAAGVAVVAAGASGDVVHCAGIAVRDAANAAEAFIKMRPHAITIP